MNALEKAVEDTVSHNATQSLHLNDGSLDYAADYSNGLLEEVVRMLLDNDTSKVSDIVSIIPENGTVNVAIVRRKESYKRGVVTYQRVWENQLRAMTKKEMNTFKSFRNHPITYLGLEYEQGELERLKREGNDFATLLINTLGANGYYRVLRAKSYHMPTPFDIRIPVEAEIQHGKKGPVTRYYVVESNVVYRELPSMQMN